MSFGRTPGGHWRRRPALFAALAIGAIAIAPLAVGCGGDDDDDTGSTSTSTSTSTGTSGASTPGSGATTPASGATTPANGDDEIPSNAEDYAEATFEAWRSGDADMLDDLAADEALTVFESEPYDTTSSWAAVGCNAGTGSVACTWQSATGETLEILVDNAMASAGEPDAVVEARFA
jgi:hypothetical protein